MIREPDVAADHPEAAAAHQALVLNAFVWGQSEGTDWWASGARGGGPLHPDVHKDSGRSEGSLYQIW